MIFTRHAYVTLLCFTLLACAAQPTRTISAAAEDRGPQKLLGFNFQEENGEAERYRFRDQGDFLISKKTFSSRIEAQNFCALRADFSLADRQFPEAMAVMSLPFSGLKKNHVINDEVLSEQKRAGVAFWATGANAAEEELFSKAHDMVYEVLSGCGNGCMAAEPLSVINERLQKIGKAPRALQAICLSEELKKSVSQ